MQVRLSPEKVKPMLQNGEFEISQKSENQIEAFKAFDHGKIHLRMKREKSRYRLQENYRWVAAFHLEKGLRPKRFFDTSKIHEFAEKYIIPYVQSE